MAVESLQKKVPIKLGHIARIARTILKYEGVREAALSIVFVSSPKIRSLNRQYLRRDHVTDVLAFDLREVKRPWQVNGDIAICAEMALKNAAAYQTSCARELVLYVAHGILHLLGFDDHSPRDIRAMRKKEREILNYLGSKIDTVVN